MLWSIWSGRAGHGSVTEQVGTPALTVYHLLFPLFFFFFSFNPINLTWASLIAQLVKNLSAMQEIPIQFLGWEGPLEKA